MEVVYALEHAPKTYSKSIFLAGPTPRDPEQACSWRPAAIDWLDHFGYDGVVFVPEDRSGIYHGDYFHQLDWEKKNLERADCILFWVPRDVEGGMPGFTTNIEWGTYKRSGKVVFGAPKEATNVRYMIQDCEDNIVVDEDSIRATVHSAMEVVQNGAERTAGERDVPLLIWNTESFQRWYAALQKAGNRLDGANLLWNFRVGPFKDKVCFWAMHVDIHVTKEDRNKVNEVVISRPDVSNVVMWYRNPNEWKVALVREFRSPVRNDFGFVWENPGGSSLKPDADPQQVAADEVFEETGLMIDPCRFKAHSSRQLAATVTTHHSALFSVQLTKEELDKLDADHEVHGNIDDSEMTYVEVADVHQLLSTQKVDWSTLGMIWEVFNAT